MGCQEWAIGDFAIYPEQLGSSARARSAAGAANSIEILGRADTPARLPSHHHPSPPTPPQAPPHPRCRALWRSVSLAFFYSRAYIFEIDVAKFHSRDSTCATKPPNLPTNLAMVARCATVVGTAAAYNTQTLHTRELMASTMSPYREKNASLGEASVIMGVNQIQNINRHRAVYRNIGLRLSTRRFAALDTDGCIRGASWELL